MNRGFFSFAEGRIVRPRIAVFDKPNDNTGGTTGGPQTLPGKWSKPVGQFAVVSILCVGAGGSGGSGRDGASGSNRVGGGGGGGGGLSYTQWAYDRFFSELDITVGTGGAYKGGTSGLGDGQAGTQGGDSRVDAWDDSGARRIIFAGGGGGGAAGGAGSGGTGGTGGTGDLTGGAGGASPGGGGAGAAGVAVSTRAPTGGGAGGGIDGGTNTQSDGGAGGIQTYHRGSGWAAPGSAAPGGPDRPIPVYRLLPMGLDLGGLGGGGSGSVAAGSSTVQRGADGIWGGGGGGGGAATGVSGLSGGSGRGGNGLVVIVCW